MVEKPEKRYPRFFIALMVGLLAGAWVSIKIAYWFADTAPHAEPRAVVIFGWALGGLTVLIMLRFGRWLDHHETVVASFENRLGGS